MRGVGPGTVLGGRYAVQHRLEHLRETERWSADDTTLGRHVSVLVIGADDHRTPALLDAARRAASVNHPVLARILDVGTDGEVSYVVEEDLSHARTLTDLVTDGGVPGDEVRRITGEVAAALESARQRGMHHLVLAPDDVLRTQEGDVRLRGLETAAVRAGQDDVEADEAARRDAVGVVALAYAALTGLWPLRSGGSGLGAAPRVPGGVAAPSEIAAGVPRDLDAICRLTINDDQGPTSPGDYARQVAPWPSRQVVGRPVVPVALPSPPVPPDPGTSPDDDVGGEPTHAEDEPPEQVPQDPPRGVTTSGEDPDATQVHSPLRALGADETRVLPAAYPVPRDDDQDTVAVAALDHDTEPVPASDPESGREDDVRTGDRRGAAAAGAAAAGAAVAGAFGTVGGRMGGLARRAVDRVAELSPDSAPRGDGALGAPAPLVPAEPLTKDESKLALAIVAVFLVIALVIGVYGVSRIGSDADLSLGGPDSTSSPTRTGPAPSPAPTGSGTGASPAPPSGAAEPLAVLKVEAYDPEGDGQENNRLTPKVYDGDTGPGWFSENYRSDEFGGLKKGLGIIVDLGPNKKPQGVELTIPVAADIEVHVGPDNRLEGATKIGEKKDAQGTVAFKVPADVSGQYVVVWYTRLTADDRGKRRAWLNEAVVTG